MVRAVTHKALCPQLLPKGVLTFVPLQMTPRAEPIVVAARAATSQADAKDAVFTDHVCEAPFPDGASSVLVGPFALTALATPQPDPQRIVIIADTGCRMKGSENAFQKCNDPAHWPFAAIARSAAEKRPDLIVHLGDLHYRESPCPDGNDGCAGSPWGYGEDVWRADFFTPVGKLLNAAPWLFVRGNHESCARAGVGWFRYFDARALLASASCADTAGDAQADFTEPFAIRISDDTQFIVFDSAATSGRAFAPGSLAFNTYTTQLAKVAQLAQQSTHNIFLNHHPVLGFAPSKNPNAPYPGNEGLRSVMSAAHPERLYANGVDTVMSGHVHLFQAIGFSSGHPNALVLGNSGTQMEGVLNPAVALQASPAAGAKVRSFATQDGYGFATLDRQNQGWKLTEWSVSGKALHVCDLKGASLSCEAQP
jgi:hypothetical protein